MTARPVAFLQCHIRRLPTGAGGKGPGAARPEDAARRNAHQIGHIAGDRRQLALHHVEACGIAGEQVAEQSGPGARHAEHEERALDRASKKRAEGQDAMTLELARIDALRDRALGLLESLGAPRDALRP